MLDKILKKYGIETVSAKTKIPRKHLVKLKEKDFEGFSKPQAYGFVKILQREYGEDFDELKSELDAWFCEGDECKEEIFVTQQRDSGSSVKKMVVLAVLILLLVGGAFIYMQERASEEPVASASSGEVQKSPSETKKVASPAQPQERQSEETAAKSEEANSTAAEPVAKKAAVAVEAANKSEEPEPYVPKENPVLTPTVKLWFGIIDLSGKKRVAKTSADPYEIDFKGKKLLVTGHGKFEISDSFGNLFKYNDAKKHYFLIDDGMVKEIPVSEFKRLNGGRIW